MRWSFSVARVFGIEVRIHATFFLLLAWLGFFYGRMGGLPAAVDAVFLVCLIFGCVLLHEFGHALTALRYGIRTPDITLLPIGGLARLERMPEKPTQELVVALAGPMVNVVIAGILFPFVHPNLDPGVLETVGPSLLTKLFAANIALVVFNLIPAFPMDGGRVFRALLAMRMDYVKATNLAATVGQYIAVAGGLWALLNGHLMLTLIAFFIFFAAQNEAAHAEIRTISRDLRVAQAMVTRFQTLPRTATLDQAVDVLLHSSQQDFPIVDESQGLVGMLMRKDIISGLRKHGPHVCVSEVMRIDIPSMQESMHFETALSVLQESDVSAMPVLDASERLTGIFTRENVGELLMVQSAIAKWPGSRPGDAPPVAPPPLPIRG